MRVERLGDSAFIVRDLPAAAHHVAAAIQSRCPAFEAVPSYETVGIYCGPDSADEAAIRAVVEGLTFGGQEVAVKSHRIPVCYEMGEDLADVSASLGVEPGDIVDLHCSETYKCHAVGFCPGFAYLGYLPDRIATVPRRATPRVRVEPGSVGITGRQTGVYPLPRPGGWNLIGKTPLELVNLEDGYFPISAGDRVSFHPIDRSEFDRLLGERL